MAEVDDFAVRKLTLDGWLECCQGDIVLFHETLGDEIVGGAGVDQGVGGVAAESDFDAVELYRVTRVGDVLDGSGADGCRSGG